MAAVIEIARIVFYKQIVVAALRNRNVKINGAVVAADKNFIRALDIGDNFYVAL